MRELNPNSEEVSNEINISDEQNKEIFNDNNNMDIDEQNNNIIENKKGSIMKDKNENTIIEKNEQNINNKEENVRINKKDISTPEIFIKIIGKTCPKILENYEIKECIGSGSESVCYKVIYKRTKKAYAMKLIVNDINKKRNINELCISNKIKNKNIITFYGVYEIKKNELDCIIMEYAKFGNLKDFRKNVLKRDYLSEQLLCFLSFQILNGIRHCHKCKIAHFDLKPQNVIIDEFLNIKIIDFSVSVDYGKIKSNKIKLPFKGTNFYVAPEIIKSKIIDIKDLNKIDLYSFGVILYNLAFCSYPYDLNHKDCDNYDITYDKINNNELKFNNEDNCYSKYFTDFLTKLLEKDINKRININQALNDYWIQGAKILFDEKENVLNASSFLIYLMTDHYISFDKYINRDIN